MLQAGTAVFDLALDSRVLRNRTSGLPMCPTDLRQTEAAALVVFADGLNTTLARLDPGGPTTLSQHLGRLDDLTTTPAGDVIAGLTGTRYRLPDVHVGPPTGPLRRITETCPELAGSPRHAAAAGLPGRRRPRAGRPARPARRTIRIGRPVPAGHDRARRPVRPLRRRFQLSWGPSAQWLATAGYAVFLPNPRGGRATATSSPPAWPAGSASEEWTDILTGIDLLVAEGVADPDRLGIAGWSHGGFMAAWAVGQTDRFSAALVGAGVTDWGMLAATGENGRSRPRSAAAPAGPASARTRTTRSARSPSPAIRTPVLILHGAEDTNVPLGQAVFLHRACATTASSTNSWSTRARATRSGNAITSSTSCAGPGPGSIAGSALTVPARHY